MKIKQAVNVIIVIVIVLAMTGFQMKVQKNRKQKNHLAGYVEGYEYAENMLKVKYSKEIQEEKVRKEKAEIQKEIQYLQLRNSNTVNTIKQWQMNSIEREIAIQELKEKLK